MRSTADAADRSGSHARWDVRSAMPVKSHFAPRTSLIRQTPESCRLVSEPRQRSTVATSPEQIHREFEAAFNAGDLDALLELYEPDAALIPQPGVVVHGLDQIGPALQQFLDIGGTISLDTKVVVTVGDLAYLTNRWTLTGTTPDGDPIDMGAVTAETARRQADGTWLYVLDNAVGDLAAVD